MARSSCNACAHTKHAAERALDYERDRYDAIKSVLQRIGRATRSAAVAPRGERLLPRAIRPLQRVQAIAHHVLHDLLHRAALRELTDDLSYRSAEQLRGAGFARLRVAMDALLRFGGRHPLQRHRQGAR